MTTPTPPQLVIQSKDQVGEPLATMFRQIERWVTQAIADWVSGGGTISDITSTGGTIDVTGATGPTTNVDVIDPLVFTTGSDVATMTTATGAVFSAAGAGGELGQLTATEVEVTNLANHATVIAQIVGGVPSLVVDYGATPPVPAITAADAGGDLSVQVGTSRVTYFDSSGIAGSVWGGQVNPNASTNPNLTPALGDEYLQFDPTGVNPVTRWHCTVVGTPGTWTNP